jgi:hypothetical protein
LQTIGASLRGDATPPTPAAAAPPAPAAVAPGGAVPAGTITRAALIANASALASRLAARIGRAPGPFAVQADGLPRVVIDPQRQQFAPGRSLKSLLAYSTAELPAEAVEALDPDAAEAALRQAGDPQPLGRLVWLLALGGGDGRVLGHAGDTRFQLAKWPQAEREFPKHFRIATVMMKGAADLAEVAQASGASLAEVIDFVNASLATGVVEPEAAPVASPDTAKGGLLARFRR